MVSLTHRIVCPTFGKATSKKFWNRNQMHTRTLGCMYYEDETATFLPRWLHLLFPHLVMWCAPVIHWQGFRLQHEWLYQVLGWPWAFNPSWVVHASRVFIPTSSLWFSWLPLTLKLIFHVDKQTPYSLSIFQTFFFWKLVFPPLNCQ